MSLKIMTAVWASTLAGPEKLVALALADWADDEGGSIRPSIATVARKTSSSESQARRTIRKLEAGGILSIEANPNGGAPGVTRHYRMHADRLPTTSTDATPRMDATPSVSATPRTDATPRMDARDGSHGCAETGGMDATLSVIEPSRTTTTAREFGFERFWNAYPTGGNRRQARMKCLDVWKRKRCADQVEAIVAHVEAMKRTTTWRDGYEPASLTYLNQERWRDGLPAASSPPQDRQRLGLL